MSLNANYKADSLDLEDFKAPTDGIHCCNIEYGTPMAAFLSGKREKLLYVCAARSSQENEDQSDFVAVVDVDENSPTYQQIIKQVNVGIGEELHHSGWNACASCFGMKGVSRKFLILPALETGNIHVIDCRNEREPTVFKVIVLSLQNPFI